MADDTALVDSGEKPWVTMAHADVEGTGSSTREAFDALWSEKGWTVVADHDEPPSGAADDEAQPERVVNGDTITDTLADPARLTKVYAGEVAAADVGVDPALEHPVDADAVEQVAAVADAPAPRPRPQNIETPATPDSGQGA